MLDEALFWEMVHDRRRFTNLENPTPTQLDTAEAARTYLECLMEPLDLEGVLAEELPSPKPSLVAIATRFPALEWLVWLPLTERRWYKRPPVLARLMAENPEMRDEEWLTLLG